MSNDALSGEPVAFELFAAPEGFCPADGAIALFEGAAASLDSRSRCPLSVPGVDRGAAEGTDEDEDDAGDDEEEDENDKGDVPAGDVPAGDVAPCRTERSGSRSMKNVSAIAPRTIIAPAMPTIRGLFTAPRRQIHKTATQSIGD